MALIRYGTGVADMRGSIGGTTYSRGRSGAIARNRTNPIQPNTIKQSGARERMQLATDAFKDLTKANVDAWAEFASTQLRVNRLGEPYVPSGKQIFTEISLNRQLIGLSPDGAALSSVVADPNLPGMEMFDFTITVAIGALTALSFEVTASSQTTHVAVQATPALLPSIRNAARYYRELDTPALVSPIDIMAAYVLAYPEQSSYVPLVGNVIHIRARALNEATGLGGNWVYGEFTVPA